MIEPLLCFLFLVVVVAAAIVLVRLQELSALRHRVARLEEEVGHLRRLASRPASPAEEPLEVLPVEEEAVQPAPAAAPAPVLSGSAPAQATATEIDVAWLESWVGQRALGWIAVVLLLFTTAFFIKYAFDNQWIGELGRVSLGVVAGAGLCVAGLAAQRRSHWLTAQMATAAGISLLYLTTFAAFGYYHLLPRDRAGFFFVLLVVESAALAVLYDAPAIAIMAVLGGLLSPLLLHSDRDEYRSLFTYLAILDAGVVALGLFRRWLYLAPIALLGSQLLYWLWHFDRYHPEKLPAALAFHLVVFVLFLIHDAIAPAWQRRRAHAIQLVQLVVNAFFLCLACHVLLDEDYHRWMPSLAVGLAIVFAALTVLVQEHSADDAPLQFALLAVSASLVAIATALRGEAGWISLGWAVEGLVLWWAGLRLRALPLRILGAVLLVLGAWRLVTIDTPWHGREALVLLFNSYALPGVAIAACVLAAAAATRHRAARLDEAERIAWWLAGLGGVLLLWLVLSVDVYQWARTRADKTALVLEGWRFAQMCLSVFWAVYAGAVLGVGFWQASRPVRITGLGLFALTLGKVVLLDMAGLQGIYRIAAFFALAVIMGAAAWGYQRIEASWHPAR